MVKKRRTPPGQGGDGAAVCRENLQQNEEQGREKQENSAPEIQTGTPAAENAEVLTLQGGKEERKADNAENSAEVSGSSETDGGVPQECGSVEEGTAAKVKPDVKQRAAAFWKEKGKPALKGLPKRWFIDAFTGMAQGLFVTLIAGTIVKTLGSLIGDNSFGNFLTLLGNIASVMMGAGIGAGMGSKLKAP